MVADDVNHGHRESLLQPNGAGDAGPDIAGGNYDVLITLAVASGEVAELQMRIGTPRLGCDASSCPSSWWLLAPSQPLQAALQILACRLAGQALEGIAEDKVAARGLPEPRFVVIDR